MMKIHDIVNEFDPIDHLANQSPNTHSESSHFPTKIEKSFPVHTIISLDVVERVIPDLPSG